MQNAELKVGSIEWFRFESRRIAELNEHSSTAEAAARLMTVCMEYAKLDRAQVEENLRRRIGYSGL